MQLIECPWCGPRDEIEFHWGGEGHIQRPVFEVGDDVWAEYLFLRDNPKGANFERWHHLFGCRRWFNAVRDTVSHKILATYAMGAPKPEIAR
jgi:sarcosine oxidase, subunit delta